MLKLKGETPFSLVNLFRNFLLKNSTSLVVSFVLLKYCFVLQNFKKIRMIMIDDDDDDDND